MNKFWLFSTPKCWTASSSSSDGLTFCGEWLIHIFSLTLFSLRMLSGARSHVSGISITQCWSCVCCCWPNRTRREWEKSCAENWTLKPTRTNLSTRTWHDNAKKEWDMSRLIRTSTVERYNLQVSETHNSTCLFDRRKMCKGEERKKSKKRAETELPSLLRSENMRSVCWTFWRFSWTLGADCG